MTPQGIKRRCWLRGLILLAVGFALAGCQNLAPANSDDPRYTFQAYDPINRSSWEERVLQAGDEVSLTFFLKDAVVPPYEGRIQADGTITLPLIGALQAAGKTPKQLQEEVCIAYDKIPRAHAPVAWPHDHSRFIYVGGEVKAPNRYVWAGEITLTKVIQAAGDFTQWADKKRVSLTRSDGHTEVVNVFKTTKDPTKDLSVYPGDKIYVPVKGRLGF